MHMHTAPHGFRRANRLFPASPRPASRRRLARWLTVLISLVLSGPAAAICKIATPPAKPVTTYTIPGLSPAVTLNYAAVGQVMYSEEVSLQVDNGFICEIGSDGRWSMGTPQTALPLAEGFDKVYRTSLPGVGVRFSFLGGGSQWPAYLAPPFNKGSSAVGLFIYTPPPTKFRVEYVRIATGVGKGAISFDYSATYIYPRDLNRQVQYILPPVNVTVANSVYYSSCVARKPTTEVPMGKGITALIRQGRSPVMDFSFDIDCAGMLSTPNPVPQVKAYFQGSTPGAGLLALDDPANRAKNVAIELKTPGGVSLPFTPNQALPLAWQGRLPGDLERYTFFGKARYVANGGTPTPGSGDATLTYVLQYN